MTKAEIQEFIDSFAKCAKLLQDAGVDGVEVHAVHEGYLLDQFTLHYVNKRTDEYGGSLENRYRFAAEIVKAIKAACGPDFPVSLRYSVVSKTKGFRQGALPGEDTRVIIALRAMQSSDPAQLAHAARLPFDLLERVTDRIRRERPEVAHVLYDLNPSSRSTGAEGAMGAGSSVIPSR